MNNESRTAVARKILVVIAGAAIVGTIAWALFLRADSNKAGDAAKTATQTSSGGTTQQHAPSPMSTTQNPQSAHGTSPSNTSDGSAGKAGKSDASPSSLGGGRAAQSSGNDATQLAQTGPSDLAPLFVGSVVAGTAIHAWYSRRRQIENV